MHHIINIVDKIIYIVTSNVVNIAPILTYCLNRTKFHHKNNNSVSRGYE